MGVTVTDATLQGAAEEPASFAWAYYPDWRGPLDLVVRIALAAVQGARDLGVTDPVCCIAVSVLPSGDVERFRSVDNLKSYLTASAIKRFHSIDIRVEDVDRRPWVAVSFAKGVPPVFAIQDAPRSCPRLERGVLLQVTPWADARRALAVEVLDMVQRAVGRGWSHGTDTSTWGETWADETPDSEVAKVLAARKRTSRRTRVASALLGPVALLFSAIAITASGVVGDALLETDSSGDVYASYLDLIVALAIGVFLGWYGIPLIKRTWAAWPSVSIGDRSPRVWRLTKALRIALVPALAGVVAVVVLGKFGISAK